VGGTVLVQTLVRNAVVTLDRVDGPEVGLYRDAHAVRPPLDTASGRLLLSRASDADWADALEDVDSEARAEAEDNRATWAAAPWLVVNGPGPGLPGHVAVPLVDAHGGVPATLVAGLPYGAQGDHVDVVAGHLARAGAAAVRMLGNA
jgi:DNA-binding IclR family transcriptional regulator